MVVIVMVLKTVHLVDIRVHEVKVEAVMMKMVVLMVVEEADLVEIPHLTLR